MITLNHEEINWLQNYNLELPAKYSLPIIDFLNKKIAESQQAQVISAPSLPPEEILNGPGTNIEDIEIVGSEVIGSNDPIDD
jgi:hypothetical protein